MENDDNGGGGGDKGSSNNNDSDNELGQELRGIGGEFGRRTAHVDGKWLVVAGRTSVQLFRYNAEGSARGGWARVGQTLDEEHLRTSRNLPVGSIESVHLSASETGRLLVLTVNTRTDDSSQVNVFRMDIPKTGMTSRTDQLVVWEELGNYLWFAFANDVTGCAVVTDETNVRLMLHVSDHIDTDSGSSSSSGGFAQSLVSDSSRTMQVFTVEQDRWELAWYAPSLLPAGDRKTVVMNARQRSIAVYASGTIQVHQLDDGVNRFHTVGESFASTPEFAAQHNVLALSDDGQWLAHGLIYQRQNRCHTVLRVFRYESVLVTPDDSTTKVHAGTGSTDQAASDADTTATDTSEEELRWIQQGDELDFHVIDCSDVALESMHLSMYGSDPAMVAAGFPNRHAGGAFAFEQDDAGFIKIVDGEGYVQVFRQNSAN